MAVADLREFARRRFGVFTLDEALGHGVRPARLRTMLRQGEVERVHRGVYRFAGVAFSWEARQLAAVRAAGDSAVVCRRSALRLHGLERAWDGIEIAAASSTLPDLGEDATVHRTRRLDRCDRMTVRGIPVTSGARTVIDMTYVLDRPALLTLLDDAVCKRVVARSWMHRRATALRNGRPGVGMLARTTAPGAEAEFRSWLERYSDGVYRYYDVPPPEWNVPINDADGQIGVVDCCWSWARLIVELEGLRFHTTPAQRRKDAQRFNRLSMCGWTVLRYTWRDVVDHPEVMVSQIRRALAR